MLSPYLRLLRAKVQRFFLSLHCHPLTVLLEAAFQFAGLMLVTYMAGVLDQDMAFHNQFLQTLIIGFSISMFLSILCSMFNILDFFGLVCLLACFLMSRDVEFAMEYSDVLSFLFRMTQSVLIVLLIETVLLFRRQQLIVALAYATALIPELERYAMHHNAGDTSYKMGKIVIPPPSMTSIIRHALARVLRVTVFILLTLRNSNTLLENRANLSPVWASIVLVGLIVLLLLLGIYHGVRYSLQHKLITPILELTTIIERLGNDPMNDNDSQKSVLKKRSTHAHITDKSNGQFKPPPLMRYGSDIASLPHLLLTMLPKRVRAAYTSCYSFFHRNLVGRCTRQKAPHPHSGAYTHKNSLGLSPADFTQDKNSFSKPFPSLANIPAYSNRNKNRAELKADRVSFPKRCFKGSISFFRGVVKFFYKTFLHFTASVGFSDLPFGDNPSQGGVREMEVVRTYLSRISRLVRVIAGEAGQGIITKSLNLDGEMKDVSRGEKVHAVFGFCDVRNFTDMTECLQEEVLSFVNDIAKIVHTEAHQSGGAPNKNIGDAFLIVWKLPSKPMENALHQVRKLRRDGSHYFTGDEHSSIHSVMPAGGKRRSLLRVVGSEDAASTPQLGKSLGSSSGEGKTTRSGKNLFSSIRLRTKMSMVAMMESQDKDRSRRKSLLKEMANAGLTDKASASAGAISSSSVTSTSRRIPPQLLPLAAVPVDSLGSAGSLVSADSRVLAPSNSNFSLLSASPPQPQSQQKGSGPAPGSAALQEASSDNASVTVGMDAQSVSSALFTAGSSAGHSPRLLSTLAPVSLGGLTVPSSSEMLAAINTQKLSKLVQPPESEASGASGRGQAKYGELEIDNAIQVTDDITMTPLVADSSGSSQIGSPNPLFFSSAPAVNTDFATEGNRLSKGLASPFAAQPIAQGASGKHTVPNGVGKGVRADQVGAVELDLVSALMALEDSDSIDSIRRRQSVMDVAPDSNPGKAVLPSHTQREGVLSDDPSSARSDIPPAASSRTQQSEQVAVHSRLRGADKGSKSTQNLFVTTIDSGSNSVSNSASSSPDSSRRAAHKNGNFSVLSASRRVRMPSPTTSGARESPKAGQGHRRASASAAITSTSRKSITTGISDVNVTRSLLNGAVVLGGGNGLAGVLALPSSAPTAGGNATPGLTAGASVYPLSVGSARSIDFSLLNSQPSMGPNGFPMRAHMRASQRMHDPEGHFLAQPQVAMHVRHGSLVSSPSLNTQVNASPHKHPFRANSVLGAVSPFQIPLPGAVDADEAAPAGLVPLGSASRLISHNNSGGNLTAGLGGALNHSRHHSHGHSGGEGLFKPVERLFPSEADKERDPFHRIASGVLDVHDTGSQAPTQRNSRSHSEESAAGSFELPTMNNTNLNAMVGASAPTAMGMMPFMVSPATALLANHGRMMSSRSLLNRPNLSSAASFGSSSALQGAGQPAVDNRYRQVQGVSQLANNALASFLNSIIKVMDANLPDQALWKYRSHTAIRTSLAQALKGKLGAGGLRIDEGSDFRIRLGFGLHIGWAIEGAIGSSIKIDASYLSPSVNVTARLESATKFYGVDILISKAFAQCLSFEVVSLLRRIDKVKLKGVAEPMELYTFDLDELSALRLLHGPHYKPPTDAEISARLNNPEMGPPKPAAKPLVRSGAGDGSTAGSGRRLSSKRSILRSFSSSIRNFGASSKNLDASASIGSSLFARLIGGNNNNNEEGYVPDRTEEEAGGFGEGRKISSGKRGIRYVSRNPLGRPSLTMNMSATPSVQQTQQAAYNFMHAASAAALSMGMQSNYSRNSIVQSSVVSGNGNSSTASGLGLSLQTEGHPAQSDNRSSLPPSHVAVEVIDSVKSLNNASNFDLLQRNVSCLPAPAPSSDIVIDMDAASTASSTTSMLVNPSLPLGNSYVGNKIMVPISMPVSPSGSMNESVSGLTLVSKDAATSVHPLPLSSLPAPANPAQREASNFADLRQSTSSTASNGSIIIQSGGVLVPVQLPSHGANLNKSLTPVSTIIHSPQGNSSTRRSSILKGSKTSRLSHHDTQGSQSSVYSPAPVTEPLSSPLPSSTHALIDFSSPGLTVAAKTHPSDKILPLRQLRSTNTDGVLENAQDPRRASGQSTLSASGPAAPLVPLSNGAVVPSNDTASAQPGPEEPAPANGPPLDPVSASLMAHAKSRASVVAITPSDQVMDMALLQNPAVFTPQFIQYAELAVEFYLGDPEHGVPADWGRARQCAQLGLKLRPSDGPLRALIEILDSMSVKDPVTGVQSAPPNWQGYRSLDAK